MSSECRRIISERRRGRATVEKLRDGSHELSWREGLRQHDAVRDAFRGPISGARSAHVDDRELRIGLAGVLGDFPPFHLAAKADVGEGSFILRRAAVLLGGERFSAADRVMLVDCPRGSVPTLELWGFRGL
jgi:hypothetical protein